MLDWYRILIIILFVFFGISSETPSQDLDETKNADFIFSHIESITFEYLNLTDGEIYSLTESRLWDIEITFEYAHDEFGIMGYWDSRNPLNITVRLFRVNWDSDFTPKQIGETSWHIFYAESFHFLLVKNWYLA